MKHTAYVFHSDVRDAMSDAQRKVLIALYGRAESAARQCVVHGLLITARGHARVCREFLATWCERVPV